MKQSKFKPVRQLIIPVRREEPRPIMPGLLQLKDLALAGMTSSLNLVVNPGSMHQIRMHSDQEADLLVQTIFGERAPESGAILFEDQELTELPPDELPRFRRSLALVSAKGGLISNLKLWENITLPLLYHHAAIPAAVEEQAMALLEKLGYTGNIWALPGHLTPMERVMAAFVRAAVSGASLILYAGNLDETAKPQRTALLHQIQELHLRPAAPAALFLTTGNEQHLEKLPLSSLQDLRHP